MRKPYFVMLYANEEGIMPMTDEDDCICQFASEEEAREGTKDCLLAQAYGFEIFNMYEGL